MPCVARILRMTTVVPVALAFVRPQVLRTRLVLASHSVCLLRGLTPFVGTSGEPTRFSSLLIGDGLRLARSRLHLSPHSLLLLRLGGRRQSLMLLLVRLPI